MSLAKSHHQDLLGFLWIGLQRQIVENLHFIHRTGLHRYLAVELPLQKKLIQTLQRVIRSIRHKFHQEIFSRQCQQVARHHQLSRQSLSPLQVAPQASQL